MTTRQWRRKRKQRYLRKRQREMSVERRVARVIRRLRGEPTWVSTEWVYKSYDEIREWKEGTWIPIPTGAMSKPFTIPTNRPSVGAYTRLPIKSTSPFGTTAPKKWWTDY